MKGGRPLKFLLLVALGWTGARAALLWPGVPIAVPAEAGPTLPGQTAPATPAPRVARIPASAAPTLAQADSYDIAALSVVPALLPFTPSEEPPPLGPPEFAQAFTPAPPALVGSPPQLARAPAQTAAQSRSEPHAVGLPGPGSVPAQGYGLGKGPVPVEPGPDRWSASTWLVARGGSMAGNGPFGPAQLGGSQAGARIRYALARALALSGRLSTPLRGIGREAGLGIEWQPLAGRIPLSVLVERRFALDSGRGGTAIGAITGINPTRVRGRLELEGYGQAGMVARARRELYADGALRLLHPVATVGRARLSVGAGAWAGAQRGARRVDVGPALVATVPTGGPTFRIAAEWRQRVAGNAAPDSGPALTLGTDF